ncbi:Predicted protein [Paenibacillus sp. P22]|nr:Predicted protein [Paenibacillus sp. P22]
MGIGNGGSKTWTGGAETGDMIATIGPSIARSTTVATPELPDKPKKKRGMIVKVTDRGFSFIEAEDGVQVFVHQSQLNEAGIFQPRYGDKVTFDIEVNARNGKEQAVNVAESFHR